MVNPLAFITETDSDRNGERPGAPETPEPFEKARTEDANGPKEVRTKRGNTDTALVIWRCRETKELGTKIKKGNLGLFFRPKTSFFCFEHHICKGIS